MMIHEDSNCLVSEKLYRPWEFGVRHFAGVVTYDATEFMEYNTDQFAKAVSDEEHQNKARCNANDNLFKTQEMIG
eukprot:11704554-Ditylum_brightwellii.AAC.1